MMFKILIKYRILILCVMILFSMILFHNVLGDVVIISTLFLSSYAIGSTLSIKSSQINKILIQTALGMGIIGVFVYFILLFGIGSKSIYIVVLLLPIIVRYKRIIRTYYQMKYLIPLRYLSILGLSFLVIIFCLYLAYGSAPIQEYDALTKHYPLTLYAVKNGAWNTNVVESLVYGESMLMQYTFSTMFLSLGAHKALALFNVFLFFTIFFMVFKFCHSLYKKINYYLLVMLFFSTPMFFEFSTIFYQEMLPLFFIMTSILCIINLDGKTIWDNLQIIGFLFGCALFSKLTVAYTIFTIGIPVLWISIKYYLKNKNDLNLFKKFAFSFIFFISPYITSIFYTWYKTGCPMFAYNGIFNSPYYTIGNFTDPFDSSVISLLPVQFIKMIFRTSQNVEMADGGLGLYLLLVIIIPFGVFLVKNKRLSFWSCIPFIAFQISAIFTYNLRYYMSIYILFLAVIVVMLSIFITQIDGRHIRKLIFILLSVILVLPNGIYIMGHYPITNIWKPDYSVTKVSNKEILSNVPAEKRVFSLNDPFKGEFNGFYGAYMWHNALLLNKLADQEIKITEYIKSFDYVLYQKDMGVYDDSLLELLDEADKKESDLEYYNETERHVLYQIKKESFNKEILLDRHFLEPPVARTDAPIVERIPKLMDKYIITHDIENKTSQSVKMRFQINWFDDQNKFINTSISEYMVESGRTVMSSFPFTLQHNGKYGVLYVSTADNQDIYVHGYKVEGVQYPISILDEEIEKLSARERLKMDVRAK